MTREPIIRNFAPEEFPIPLTFVNPATTAGKELDVWNTGLSAAGEPHFREGNKGEAIVPTEGLVQNPEILKNAFELRLYRTNEFITLIPGDQVMLNVHDSKELAYYLSIPDSDLFTILERDTYAIPYEMAVTVTAEEPVGTSAEFTVSVPESFEITECKVKASTGTVEKDEGEGAGPYDYVLTVDAEFTGDVTLTATVTAVNEVGVTLTRKGTETVTFTA